MAVLLAGRSDFPSAANECVRSGHATGVAGHDAALVPWSRSGRKAAQTYTVHEARTARTWSRAPSQVFSGVTAPDGENEWGRLLPFDRLPVIRVAPSAPDMWAVRLSGGNRELMTLILCGGCRGSPNGQMMSSSAIER